MYPVTPIRADFGKENNEQLGRYVSEQLTSLIASNSELHETKVKKWRRNYKGIPRVEKKSFPWENASNVVIQVIGTAVDVAVAKTIAAIYEVMPLYVAQVVGEWEDEQQAEEQRAAIEEAMSYFGLEPGELDLYRIESLVFNEAVKFGTAFCKAAYHKDVENLVVSIDGRRTEKENYRFDGPRPEKIPFEDFLVSPNASTLEAAEFKAHRVKLTKFQLEERKYRGLYTKDKVESILQSPDRGGPSPTVVDKNAGEGIHVPQGFHNAEWDIYECWFPYWHNGTKYRLICTYHLLTKTVLKCVFNFYPNNIEPFRMARLGYTDDGIYGYGFSEMLEHYQEEVSTIHNQRGDNRTLANTAAMRVSRASKLDSVFSIYPGAVIPGEKDEIENLQLGSNYPSSVAEENLTLALAEKRAGVDAGMAGQGGGTTSKKGIYSAMGTFSVLQSGNRRSNINITDMRYFHIELGRLVLQLYANFGLGGKEKIFGKQAPVLLKALDSVKQGKISFPIRAATASINRELEKQNDMLLSNLMTQHYQATAQLWNLLTGPQGASLSQETKEYMFKSLKAKDQLLKHILRNFGHEDTSRLLPEVEPQQGQGPQQGAQINGVGAGSQQPEVASQPQNPLLGANGVPTPAPGNVQQ